MMDEKIMAVISAAVNAYIESEDFIRREKVRAEAQPLEDGDTARDDVEARADRPGESEQDAPEKILAHIG